MSIKFSVICPCYNSESYVRKAVESVLNQTYQNLELILVDDGSTDSTLNILNEYANNDKRIKIIHKQNGGYCSAINTALEHIDGDYFLMMGSDDWLDVNIFTNIINDIKDYQAPDIIGFKTMQISYSGSKTIEESTKFEKSFIFNGNYKDFYEKHAYESKIFRVRDTSKIFKTSLIKNQQYFGKYGYDADGVFSILFSHKCLSFFISNNIGYYWQLRSDSLSGKKVSYIGNIDRLKIWTKYVNCIAKLNNNELSKIDFSYATKGAPVISKMRNDHFSFHDIKLVLNYIKSIKKLSKLCNVKFGKRFWIYTHFPITAYTIKFFK